MFKRLKIAWIGIVLCVVYLPLAHAGVYQCVSPEGVVEYRDRPCQSESNQQTFVPIQYQTTQEKKIKQDEKVLKITQKQVMAGDKKSTRKKKSNYKKLTIEKNKQERLKKRCVRLDEKINHIESQLRAGCKLKKANRLKTQLEDFQAKKAELSTNE